MRLAIALSFLSQSLPVASKNKDNANPVLLIDIENQNNARQRLLFNEKASRTQNSLAENVYRNRKQTRTNNQVTNSHGALRNMVTTKDECDPSTYEADVGMLFCDTGKYCKPSNASGLGGFCADVPTFETLWEESTLHNVILHEYLVRGPGYVNGTAFSTYCFNAPFDNKTLCFRALSGFYIPNPNVIGMNCTIAFDGTQCNSCYYVTDSTWGDRCQQGEISGWHSLNHFAFDCKNAGLGAGSYSCLDDIILETLLENTSHNLRRRNGGVLRSPGCDSSLSADEDGAKWCYNATFYDKSLCFASFYHYYEKIGSNCTIAIDGDKCQSCYYVTHIRAANGSTAEKCSGPISKAISHYDHFVFDCENIGFGTGDYSCIDDIPGSENIVMGCNDTLTYEILKWHDVLLTWHH